jgi:hypothetical protein
MYFHLGEPRAVMSELPRVQAIGTVFPIHRVGKVNVTAVKGKKLRKANQFMLCVELITVYN